MASPAAFGRCGTPKRGRDEAGGVQSAQADFAWSQRRIHSLLNAGPIACLIAGLTAGPIAGPRGGTER
ncbi:MAG TPA: hypothetical protein VFQ39_18785 [Longimicrobium sp.]|nr:hypothetical protein [Longimicrobium sp.]